MSENNVIDKKNISESLVYFFDEKVCPQADVIYRFCYGACLNLEISKKIVLNTKILTGDSQIDEYPFILLNLLLSCIAALQAPIIMMSQNRQAAKDSLRNQNDYRTDLKSEIILEELHDKMELILRNQRKIMKYLEEEDEKK